MGQLRASSKDSSLPSHSSPYWSLSRTGWVSVPTPQAGLTSQGLRPDLHSACASQHFPAAPRICPGHSGCQHLGSHRPLRGWWRPWALSGWVLSPHPWEWGLGASLGCSGGRDLSQPQRGLHIHPARKEWGKGEWGGTSSCPRLQAHCEEGPGRASLGEVSKPCLEAGLEGPRVWKIRGLCNRHEPAQWPRAGDRDK